MRRLATLTALLFAVLPATAYGASSDIPPVLSSGAGVLGLLFAAALLAGMLSLRRITVGAAIAENITWAVLAVLCLAASLLVGWIGRWLPAEFSAERARLGADLLSVASLALFGVYFWRVRLAMTRLLDRLCGEEQLLTTVVDVDAEQA